MAGFKTVAQASTNPYLAGLTTSIPFDVPTPVGWDNAAPLKFFFDDTGPRAWSVAEKAAIVKGFASWSNVANIDFVETTVRAEADLIPELNNSVDDLGSVSSFPDGDVRPISIRFSLNAGNFDNLGFGGDSYETVIHEIGHALGLYHPHNGTLFPGVADAGDQDMGDLQLNQQIWTVMSYVVGWTGQPVTTPVYGTAATPMAFDIAAIQLIYGARAANTGDNVYIVDTTNALGTGWQAIWDTGGNDTISALAATVDTTIDLRDAPLTGANAGGYVSWTQGIVGGFTIANGAIIENAVGGTANDTLTGNAVDNVLVGGMGNDTLDGGAGSDTAGFVGNFADYTIVKGANNITTITDTMAGRDGVDTVVNIEFYRFTDQTIDANAAAPIDWKTDVPSMEVVAGTYQFFTGKAPTAAGFEYLISSATNANDLNDAAYAQFNTENRFINFANNLGSVGAGKDAFAAKYGAMTLTQTIQSAFEEIISSAAVTNGGGDPQASLNFFNGSIAFYTAIANERVVPSGVSLEQAVKVVAIGSILNEAMKANLGLFSDAIDVMTNQITATGTSTFFDMDLLP